MRILTILTLTTLLLVSCGKDEYADLSPEEYIVENNLSAEELDEGVFIVVHEEGGEKPTADDAVSVITTLKLTDGTVLYEDEPFQASISALITGFRIGLVEMGVGGRATLIIPPKAGFGDEDLNSSSGLVVPKNSTLVYEVELVEILEIRSIEEYISDEELETTELEKGVHIVIHDPGNDTKPTSTSTVVVDYVGRLTNSLVFDQGANVSFPLGNLIEGWQRIVGEFTVPLNTANFMMKLTNNNQSIPVYFDDIRVHPFNGNMKSFVYDPETQRLMAELDENNYATFFEYDNEGGLVRVKKETEKGVYTMEETRSGDSKLTTNQQQQ